MKKFLIVLSAVVVGASFGAVRAAAQGPAGAGAGAAEASSAHSPHSYNPIHWIKKGPKKDADANNDQTTRLNDRLKGQGLLPSDVGVKEVCTDFKDLNDCLAALHASHNLGLNFACVRANTTGIKTGVDAAGCKMAETDKPLKLVKTIKLLKPGANAKSAAKDAETLAKEDLKETAS
jgi:hypothetical protein